jgi:predicted DNA-binding transcriptional regulator YafY
VAERTTAEGRLHRLLALLPVAAREGGASLNALAVDIGVAPRELMLDINEATTGTFHHPPGTAEPFSILLEAGDDGDTRVHVHTTGEFQRPARLTPHEALAVALGLRAMAAEVVADRRTEALGLARRIEGELTSPDVRTPVDEAGAAERRRAQMRATAAAPEAASSASSPPDIEAILSAAASRRHVCRVTYMKPGEAPAERIVEPYRLVHASGLWYVLGHDVTRSGIRYFRVDRISAADVDENQVFEVPADFDAAKYLTDDGRPFSATGDDEVVVRYVPPAAAFVAEDAGVKAGEDGSVVIRQRVADRRWLVRHVLSFGGAAEVIAPQDVRREVAEVAKRLAG